MHAVRLPPILADAVHVKVGVPTNPFKRVTWTDPVRQEPLFTVSDVGEKAREKFALVEASPVLAGETEVQFVTKVNALIEPNPVAKSYPVPAPNPMLLIVPHALLNGTSLFPIVTSWKAVGVRAASGYRIGLMLPKPFVGV